MDDFVNFEIGRLRNIILKDGLVYDLWVETTVLKHLIFKISNFLIVLTLVSSSLSHEVDINLLEKGIERRIYINFLV